MELEVKVLNINKEEFIKKIKSLGATLKKETKQFLYTYDLPTIYGRFIDIKTQLKDHESNIKYETAIEKLKLLFFELDNLLTEKNKKELKEIMDCDNLSSICQRKNILEILDNKKVMKFIEQFHNNSKKWIRVRQTNDKTTIAIKHILADNGTGIQQMLETEMEVPSIKEANGVLEALGYSYKSYQEMEVEGTSKEDLKKILKKLGYSMKDTVSCTADEIYEMYGLSMFDCREIKFENFK